MKHSFVHLHLHSEYSVVDGLVRINPLVEECVATKMPAVAITDQTNLFACIKFYKQAISRGIKPIIGAQITIQDIYEPQKFYQSVLLCRNREGYKNLIRLISSAYKHGQESGSPIVKQEWVEQAADGLIMLSGGIDGALGQNFLTEYDSASRERIKRWLRIFPNCYYLEIQRIGHPREEDIISKTISFADDLSVPVVATNDVRFLVSDDFDAHEARVCIHGGYVLDDPSRPRHYFDQQYLRTPDEMSELFKDIPSALENTVEIAKRCNVELELGKVVLPTFPTPNNLSADDYLVIQSKEGLNERFLQQFDTESKDFPDKKEFYNDRLAFELKTINKMGYAGYFLIVADFIKWAKENSIPVGPGRGSGAGSLVAYAIGITDIDPLQYDLLFERFLNPERISMPDFDIDFCMEGRDRVIEYVANRYGRENVSQIITFGTMAAKAVVRDVGRVLGHPYGFVDKIAKLIPFELGITLDKAIAEEDALRERYEKEDDVSTLIDLAKKLEGVVRNAGTHAGGVVIAPSSLDEFTPIYCEPDAKQIISQYDKDDVEAVGLVKFDFLGLRTLTIIDWTLRTINKKRLKQGKEKLDILNLDIQDKETFKFIRTCKTSGVFQIESRVMREHIKRQQTDCFEDIVALIALVRPGPLQSGMVDDFINCKHGRAVIKYLHPSLESILCPTYGVILYQEQVMQIAQKLAGYSLGSADILRKAMGKKNPAQMVKQRTVFLKGAVENGIKASTATQIFDLMENFAGYGFNKSHSAAYALISFQTAWLKAHYPSEFMSSVLSSDMDHTDKITNLIDECKSMKLKVKQPDVNSGQYKFSVDEDGSIIYGLGAIKGIGESVVNSIVASRDKEGPFKSLFDFCSRVDLKKVNRRTLEAFIYSGALDNLGTHRASLFESIETALRFAEQKLKNLQSGQLELFGNLTQDDCAEKNYIDVPKWSDEERLQGEKKALGLYLTGHPIEAYEKELGQLITAQIGKLELKQDKTIIVAGFLSAIRTLMTKRNDRMAFLTLADRTGRLEVAVFADDYITYRDLLKKDQLLIMEVSVSYDDASKGYKLRANKIMEIDKARNIYAKYIMVTLSKGEVNETLIKELQEMIDEFKNGSCPVLFEYHGETSKANIHLSQELWVHPTDNLIKPLKQLVGEECVSVCY